MDFGVVFPTTQIGTDPAVIRDFAQTAEGLGYRRLLVYDHVLGAVHADRDPPLPGPYTEHDPFHEPLVLLGFLAACTTTIELGIAVLVLPQRQTALVAKQAAEVDVLSSGRLVLAVGTGWNHVEYESLGASFEGRGRRLDEQVDLLRLLWRQPVVDYRGEFHRIDRAGLSPRPVRGDIPLYFGGGAEASLKRAARTGDGFVFGSASPHTHQRAWPARAAGRAGPGPGRVPDGHDDRLLPRAAGLGGAGAGLGGLRRVDPVHPDHEHRRPLPRRA